MNQKEVYELIQATSCNLRREDLNFDPAKEFTLNRHKTRLAMEWIRKWHSVPPEGIMHAADLKYTKGFTLEMEWIKLYKELPPPELRHDTDIRNNEGHTCAMIWIQCTKELPPRELRHDMNICTYHGITCADIWITKNNNN